MESFPKEEHTGNAPLTSLVKEAPILKKIKSSSPKKTILIGLGAVVIILLGVGSGWLLSGKSVNKVSTPTQKGVTQTATEAGVNDTTAFPDTAQGLLKDGGINGVGTHHLEREGGQSHWVYLSSTVIDLQGFVGKNVEVWGQTLSAKGAPWLMDVGKIKVVQ